MARILVTGMSGTGKSALIGELRRRGYAAYDADDDGFSEPRGGGRWGWRVELVRDLLDRYDGDLLFFAGCSEEQTLFDFDLKVLLTVPEPVMIERLRTRSGNSYGRGTREMEQVMADRRMVEPHLRQTADLILDTTLPLGEVVNLILDRVENLPDSDSA